MTLPVLTPQELDLLAQLYADGAWNQDELHAAFSGARIRALHEATLLATVPTELGQMTLLAAAGRKVTWGIVGQARSLPRQIDRAYLRLSAHARGWSVPDEGTLPQVIKRSYSVWQPNPRGHPIR